MSLPLNTFQQFWLDKILAIEKGNHTTKVYAHVGACRFEIIALDNGNLKLYNTFEYNNSEDFIYYLLFTLEQLDYNPEIVDVVLFGNIASEESELYKIAYKYIRNITLQERKNSIITDIDSKQSNFIITNSF